MPSNHGINKKLQMKVDEKSLQAKMLPSNCNLLHQAVEEGMVDYLESQLKTGIDINKKKSNGWTLIHTAVSNNQLEAVKLLIKYGANLNVHAKDAFREMDTFETPLHLATFNGNDEITKLLIKHGANVNANVKGILPLHLAVCNNDLETINLILDKTDNINSKDENGSTPLHRAIWMKKVEVIKILISRGANIESKTNEDLRPIHVAVMYGNFEILEILLKKGASVNAKSSVGLTPLHLLVQNLSMKGTYHFETRIENRWKSLTNGLKKLKFSSKFLEIDRLRILRLLLKNNANVEESCNLKQTPLILASKEGFLEIGKLLIQHGADVNVIDYKDFTPLHYAVMSSHLEFVKLLLKNGSLVDSPSTYHQPLHWVSSYEVAKELVDNGANVNCRDLHGNRPIHYAVEKNAIDLFNLLVDKGANINVKNGRDCTPLVLAIERNNIEMIKLLIANGANVNTMSNGNTPIHLAVKTLNLEVTRLLVKSGADINKRTFEGKLTALHIAIAYGNPKLIVEGLERMFLIILQEGVYYKGHSVCGNSDRELKNRNSESELIAEILIRHGANINVKTASKFLAIHFAMFLERKHIQLRMLQTGKIDANHKIFSDQTLLMFAFRLGLMHSIPILIDNGASLTIRNDHGEDPKEFLMRKMDISKLKQVLALQQNV